MLSRLIFPASEMSTLLGLMHVTEPMRRKRKTKRNSRAGWSQAVLKLSATAVSKPLRLVVKNLFAHPAFLV